MLDSIQPRIPQHQSLWQKPKKPKWRLRAVLVLLIIILLVIGISVGSKLKSLAQKILEGEGQEFSFRQLFLGGDKPLIGEEEGHIYILLMGIGGEKHEGGTLTDTMILTTIEPAQTKNEQAKVGMVSIPRDLVVNIPGFDYRKINEAYAYGEMGGKKQGPMLAIKTVEQLLGIKIPYYATVDFEGFKQIIDDLGGVEITVEQGFTDPLYPNDLDGYLPPVTFEAGRQKMYGEQALQFVRSRHGNNNQGTDFARAKRQQLVIKALKQKLTNLTVLTNLSLIERILDDFTDHIRTNLKPYELSRIYNLTKNIDSHNISSLAINHESGLVCDQITEDTKAYILVPCQGLTNYEAIRNLIRNQFLLFSLQTEQPLIEIQKVFPPNFSAQELEKELNLPYLKVVSTNFKGNTNYEKSIIYDNTRGQKLKTLKFLQDKLGFKVAESPFPFSTSTPTPDFVIILAP